jgi:hypothetical protein
VKAQGALYAPPTQLSSGRSTGAVSIGITAVALLVLTAIFFQDALVRRPKTYVWVRRAYLTFTLVWLGWYVKVGERLYATKPSGMCISCLLMTRVPIDALARLGRRTSPTVWDRRQAGLSTLLVWIGTVGNRDPLRCLNEGDGASCPGQGSCVTTIPLIGGVAP